MEDELDVKQRGRDKVLDKKKGKKRKQTKYWGCNCIKCDNHLSNCMNKQNDKIFAAHEIRLLLRSSPKELAKSNTFFF